MRRWRAAAEAGLVLVVGCVGTVSLPSSRDPLPGDSLAAPAESIIERQIDELVNRRRTSQGLPVLVRDTRLDAIAREHSRAMASRRRAFGHDGFEARAAAIGQIMNMRSMAENVAYDGRGGAELASFVVDGWIASSGHRQNIEGDFTLSGIGAARGNDGVRYFTQIFVKGDG